MPGVAATSVMGFGNEGLVSCLPENEEILQRICEYKEGGATLDEDLLSKQDAT